MTSVSWTLTAGAHVERLQTADSSGTSGSLLSGNALGQAIFGNAGAKTAGRGQRQRCAHGAGRGGCLPLLLGARLDQRRPHHRLFGGPGPDPLDYAVFTGLSAGAQASSRVPVEQYGQAADNTDRIIYDRDDGILYFDRDGAGDANRVRFAILDDG